MKRALRFMKSMAFPKRAGARGYYRDPDEAAIVMEMKLAG